MIDHVILRVKDLAASRRFYEAALGPLGYGVVMEFPEAVAFGDAERPEFWIGDGEPRTEAVHLAFRCRDRNVVDAFYEAGLTAGGRDNGPPGIREQYHPSYYGAFVLDPDGNNIEAVCHAPEA